MPIGLEGQQAVDWKDLNDAQSTGACDAQGIGACDAQVLEPVRRVRRAP